MHDLSIDIETFSSVDIGACGHYKYAASPDFKILLFAFSIDGGDVEIVDLTQGEKLPDKVLLALTDDRVLKHAWNASFERICLSHYLGTHLPATSWRCTMVHAAALGMPLSLKDAGAAFNLSDQKMSEGTSLIKLFSCPQKDGHRVLSKDAPDKWETFKAYCKRDVEVEAAIQTKLTRVPLPQFVWEEYAVDQAINDRGVRIDRRLAEASISLAQDNSKTALKRASKLTGLDNPNSPIQLKSWLEEHGLPLDSLDKATVEDALARSTGVVHEVLSLRGEYSRSSVKKYEKMLACADTYDRAHGLHQFMGAGRTGRWAGRLLQVQNLPRNYLADLEATRELVKSGDLETMKLLYPSVADTLSQLIRTALIPSENSRFIVADFSAIEARVLAWLAGESWVLHAFATGEDIYCKTASQMFGVPVVKHGVNGELRQKGKIATLACGYAGAVGALRAMGAERMGLNEVEMETIVGAWREANSNIVQFWRDIEVAALNAIKKHVITRIGKVSVGFAKGMLTIKLPSSRCLYYARPQIAENRFGAEGITYWGLGAARKFQKLETYGGKLVENITQAIARDILAEALVRLEKAGYHVVMHVHDEVICDEQPSFGSLDEVVSLMCVVPTWAQGLPLNAEGFEADFYKKD